MKRNILMQLALIASIASTTLVLAQSRTAPKSDTPPAKSAATTKNAKQPDGERKFDANCGRCHSAPEQLSPSLTGTVVRHMRVRASLSVQDEKDILKYLAP
jgi:cytochrome c5